MSYTILEILKIKTEQDLDAALGNFESDLYRTLKPLRDRLVMQILTQDVPELELHMTFVECWRDRVGKYLSLASCFVEHGESTDFLLPTSKGVTAMDREAYMTKMTKGFSAIKKDLEELIRSIDSRVNLCKKLLGIESEGFNGRNKF